MTDCGSVFRRGAGVIQQLRSMPGGKKWGIAARGNRSLSGDYGLAGARNGSGEITVE
jgi:hypothetical protein